MHGGSRRTCQVSFLLLMHEVDPAMKILYFQDGRWYRYTIKIYICMASMEDTMMTPTNSEDSGWMRKRVAASTFGM